MLGLQRKVWLGPDTEGALKDCDRRIQELKEWATSGKKGLPPDFRPSAGVAGRATAIPKWQGRERRCPAEDLPAARRNLSHLPCNNYKTLLLTMLH
jgi:hypothetical protein